MDGKNGDNVLLVAVTQCQELQYRNCPLITTLLRVYGYTYCFSSKITFQSNHFLIPEIQHADGIELVTFVSR